MSKPNFTGRWRFNPEDSRLEIATPDAVVFEIRHSEPSFRFERILTFGDRTDKFELELMVGTTSSPFSRGDATLHPSLKWKENKLEFMTRIEQGEEESTNLVVYGLEEDGELLVAEESFRGPRLSYKNRWVFRKERKRE